MLAHPLAALSTTTQNEPKAEPAIAVLIPCYNEEMTVAGVIRGFRESLPSARIIVFDNNSRDRTVEVARAEGAEVRFETRQGKGYVVRRMFADINADIYVLVDGDETYDASAAPVMIERMVDQHLDFINGARREDRREAYRPAHKLGNRLLSGTVRMIFGRDFSDMLSGYKIFSRRYVQSFPAMSRGFEIETELTIHALELRMPYAEIETAYRERPAGSSSKLRTIPDGIKIASLILRLVKDERPMIFFGGIGVFCALCGVLFGAPVVSHFLEFGLVPRLPTALLSASLMILAALFIVTGLVLDLVTKTRQEIKRLVYLASRRPD